MRDIRNLNIWKSEKEIPKSSTDEDLAVLNLSVRSYNCLKRYGCQTVQDVRLLLDDEDGGDLRKIKNLGTVSEAEIREKMKNYDAQSRQRRPEIRPQESGASIRILVRHSTKIREMEIADLRLSAESRKALRSCGIYQVKDLYEPKQGKEPGWYAVRELFEKIAQIS